MIGTVTSNIGMTSSERSSVIREMNVLSMLQVTPMEIDDTLTDLQEQIKTSLSVINKVVKIVVKIEKSGVSFSDVNNLLEILPDLDLPTELETYPKRAVQAGVLNKPTLLSAIGTSGLLGAIDSAKLRVSLDDIAVQTVHEGKLYKLASALTAIRNLISLSTQRDSNTATLSRLLHDKEELQSIIKKPGGPVRQLVQYLSKDSGPGDGTTAGMLTKITGEDEVGSVKIASDTAQSRIIFVNHALDSVLYATSDYSDRIDQLSGTLTKMQDSVTDLIVLNKVLTNWDNTHRDIIKALT